MMAGTRAGSRVEQIRTLCCTGCNLGMLTFDGWLHQNIHWWACVSRFDKAHVRDAAFDDQ